jgi:putative nucleotidyltransferase with HDIG domain
VSRILFVDNESNVLDGLKRMLYGRRHDWQMTFVTSGQAALKCLGEEPFDLVMTAVRMPGMNGIELLREMVSRHPNVIRIVFSGTADAELTLQSVSLAHQYIMKPCDGRALRSALERALCLRVLLHNPMLRDLVLQVQTLPSIPAVYSELVRVLDSTDASPALVGSIMARDMGMTAKVLQLVNSAFFGVSREIVNPVDAVIHLGMETVRALVFTASAFSQFRLPASSTFSIDDLQQHSLAVGTLARHIARFMGLDPAAADHAFVGGLLHDIGKLVLVCNFPQQYQAVMHAAGGGMHAIHRAECREFGTTHAEIGAYLLWLWGLPELVTEILALHHRPSCDAEVRRPVVAVHVANALVNGYGETDIDFASLKAVGAGTAWPQWQKMYEEATEVSVW